MINDELEYPPEYVPYCYRCNLCISFDEINYDDRHKNCGYPVKWIKNEDIP